MLLSILTNGKCHVLTFYIITGSKFFLHEHERLWIKKYNIIIIISILYQNYKYLLTFYFTILII